jgi:hypothetical protein
VQASPGQMATAKAALKRLYSELGEDAPDSLMHYGVKGMHWGVHNGEIGSDGTRSQRKAAKKESKLAYKDWKKEVGGEKVADEIFQQALKTFGPAVKAINNDPAFKGKDLTKDLRLQRQYDTVTSTVFNQHLAQASIDRTTTNTGRAMIYQFDSTLGMMRATEHQMVVHANEEDYPEFVAEMDELGHIVSLRLDDGKPFIAQSDSDDFFAHYGVKGMKWGVRKNEARLLPGASTSMKVGRAAGNAVARRRKKSSSSEPASEDFSRATDLHSRAKSHGTRVLTNAEMRKVIERMNLEKQYSELNVGEGRAGSSKARKEGTKFVTGVLKNVGQQVAAEILKGHAMARAVDLGLTAAKK